MQTPTYPLPLRVRPLRHPGSSLCGPQRRTQNPQAWGPGGTLELKCNDEVIEDKTFVPITVYGL